MRKYLIKHFIITIICIGIAEYFIGIFQEYAILPLLKNSIETDVAKNWSINGVELVILAVASLVSVLSKASGLKIINIRANAIIATILPKLNMYAILSTLIYIIPYSIGIWAFAMRVSNKIKEQEDERNRDRLEFEKRRNLMLSDIAHDLRTPITTISGYAKALADGMITDETKEQEYLMAIQSKSARVEELIKLLFEYVKLDSEGFTLDKEEVDICELLRENAALAYSDIEEAGMELDVDIPEEAVKLSLDKLQISRVVTNLLINATRHNKPGTKIAIIMRQRPGIIIIDIADNGELIPDEVKKTLFDPFSKGDKSRSNASGSGLGLSIAHKVISMHGWKFELTEDVEGYSKAFEITILQN